jgi:ABC-type sugar transport system ATPase subunit
MKAVFAAGRRGNARVSGGNQQRALFGKGFGGDYDLYIMQIGSYMKMVLLGSR